jgi:hypothetical protein
VLQPRPCLQHVHEVMYGIVVHRDAFDLFPPLGDIIVVGGKNA